MSYYTTISSGGDLCTDDRDLYVMLYPNTSNEDSYAQSGSIIVDALEYMCDQLLNSDAINYWEIQQFKVKDYNYTDLTEDQCSKAQCNFREYLLDPDTDKSCNGTGDTGIKHENGTGDDLTSILGCHLLLHNEGDCTTDYNGAGGGSENCDTGSAFITGRAAWMKVSCSDSDKVKITAIQETLHQFINEKFSCVDDKIENCEDEHALGKIYDDGKFSNYGTASPMITYHEDESNVNDCGSCADGNTFSGDWSQLLTSCTEGAVGCTGRNQCKDIKDC